MHIDSKPIPKRMVKLGKVRQVWEDSNEWIRKNTRLILSNYLKERGH